jgi:tetratricopeptide (TPR) repeat protein
VSRSAQRIGWVLATAVAVAACGGEPDPSARHPSKDAVPLLAAVASPPTGPVALLRAGDLAGARAGFELSLAANPDRLDALNDLAVSYILQARPESARQLLDEVVKRGASREQQVALVNLGELYALDGYPSAAQAYFESARSIDPTWPEPHYALALLADIRGDRAAATATLKEAVRLDDGSRKASLAFVHPEEKLHLEALLLELSGDREAAVARWRELRSGRFGALSDVAERHLGEQ